VVIEPIPPSLGSFVLRRRSSSFVIALTGIRNKGGPASVFQEADAVPDDPQRLARERFRVLAEEQLPRLYAIGRRLVGDEAEDAVQDTLLKAYRGFDRLEHANAAPAWLTTILVNVCRDRGRARARAPHEISIDAVEEFSLFRKIADEDPFPYSDSLHLDFLEQFGPEDVRAVLERLPDRYRIPLVLVYVDGFATKEVARLLESPLGTVLAQLHRGRKLFEQQLWGYAEEKGLLVEGAR
jgi:RNA polymerase sigma-70 factor (ECF subfamily)